MFCDNEPCTCAGAPVKRGRARLAKAAAPVAQPKPGLRKARPVLTKAEPMDPELEAAIRALEPILSPEDREQYRPILMVDPSRDVRVAAFRSLCAYRRGQRG